MTSPNEGKKSALDIDTVVFEIPPDQRKGELKTLLSTLATPLGTTAAELDNAFNRFIAFKKQKVNTDGQWSIYGTGESIHNNPTIILMREDGTKYTLHLEVTDYKGFDQASQSMKDKRKFSITGVSERFADVKDMLEETTTVSKGIRSIGSKVNTTMKI